MQVGAQSKDKALQVIAFLPNEIWIHAGDSIAFKVATDEPHTVTFLTPNQVVPPFSVGCPGSTPSGVPEDGSTCVNSGTLTNGQSYSVTFPEPGDYKLICLYHQNHTAVIHVLDLSAQLPHEQAFYSAEAADMQRNLLSSADNMMNHDMGSSRPGVTAGTGSILATGGGSNTLSIVRFMHPDKIVHVRDTVEWTNDDPITPHTITFGVEPANPMPPFNERKHGSGRSAARYGEFAKRQRALGVYRGSSTEPDRFTAATAERHSLPRDVHAAGHFPVQMRAA